MQNRIITKDGRYEGSTVNGVIEGEGVFYYTNGDIYQGFFRGGQRNGYGVYRCKNGTIYKGNWSNGKYHGVGIVEAADYKYEGQFVNGNFHGYGIIDFKDGRFYIGSWQDNRQIGNGTYYFADGLSQDIYFPTPGENPSFGETRNYTKEQLNTYLNNQRQKWGTGNNVNTGHTNTQTTQTRPVQQAVNNNQQNQNSNQRNIRFVSYEEEQREKNIKRSYELLNQGNDCYNNGDFVAAISFYRQAMSLNNDKGFIAECNQNIQDANTQLQDAKTYQLYEQARECAEEGNLKGAQSLIRRMIASTNNKEMIREGNIILSELDKHIKQNEAIDTYNYAVELYNCGNYTLAIDYFNKAISQSNDKSFINDCKSEISDCYKAIQAKYDEEAQREFDDGVWLFNSGRYREAMWKFERARELVSSDDYEFIRVCDHNIEACKENEYN